MFSTIWNSLTSSVQNAGSNLLGYAVALALGIVAAHMLPVWGQVLAVGVVAAILIFVFMMTRQTSTTTPPAASTANPVPASNTSPAAASTVSNVVPIASAVGASGVTSPAASNTVSASH